MDHPLVIDPSHPLVVRVRATCMPYPEAVEVPVRGRPSFRAGKRVFVMLSASMDRPYSIVFCPDEEERMALLAEPRFFVPPYEGPRGKLATDIDSPSTDWTEIAELIDTSYRQVALRRQLVALDASGAGPLV